MRDWRSYDDVAATYARIHAPRLAGPAQDLLTSLAPPEGGRFLDLGTGTGTLGRLAASSQRPPALTVGADPSVGMLAEARRAEVGFPLVAAAAIDLPFRDGTFDAVGANFVIAHFTKLETAMFDALRVLRPGGRFGASVWAGGPDDLSTTWLELVHQVVPRDILSSAVDAAAPWRDRLRDRTRFEEALVDAGLRGVRVEAREFRFSFPLEEYLEGLSTWATGRFVRGMVGDAGWARLMDRARTTFGERFADPVNDFRSVWIGVGTRT